jgi:hypothetical protein
VAYTRFKQVTFDGLGDTLAVGFQLFDANGAPNGIRTTAGISLRGAGSETYGALITFPTGFQGDLRWDSGGANPVIANEEINPVPFEDAVFTEIVGLLGKNQVLGNTLYDESGLLVSATIRIYDTAANANTDDGATGLLHSYSLLNEILAGNVAKQTFDVVS